MSETETTPVIEFTPSQIETLSRTVARDVKSDTELDLFLAQCRRTGLDPFSRQIYFMRTGGRPTIVVSIDGFRLIASRSGRYAGQTPPEWCGTDGQWRDVWLESTPPAASRVGVYLDGQTHPVWGVVTWNEFGKGKGSTWSSMPSHMLAKCFDPETEVLTEDGFRRFEDVGASRVMQVTDTGLEPVKAEPFAQIYEGEMIGYHSEHLDFMVTPNHDMVTTFGKVEAGAMYETTHVRGPWLIPRVVDMTKDKAEADISDMTLKIAAAIVADGTASNSGWRVSVSRKRKVDALDALGGYKSRKIKAAAGAAADVGTRVITTKSDQVCFSYGPNPLVGADKRLIDIEKLSARQCRTLVDALVFFDGHQSQKPYKRRYYTSDKVLAGQVEVLAVRAGYSVNVPRERESDISTKPNYAIGLTDRRPVHRITRPSVNERGAKRVPLIKEPNTSGVVWCVTVPSGEIVVRRNGFSFRCGNCAESHALRKAFPNEMSGLFTADEMQAAGAVSQPEPKLTSTETANVILRTCDTISEDKCTKLAQWVTDSTGVPFTLEGLTSLPVENGEKILAQARKASSPDVVGADGKADVTDLRANVKTALDALPEDRFAAFEDWLQGEGMKSFNARTNPHHLQRMWSWLQTETGIEPFEIGDGEEADE